MSATEVLREIETLSARIKALEGSRKKLNAERDRALALPDPAEARRRAEAIEFGTGGGLGGFDRQPGLRDVERELSFLASRREALKEQLPTPAERQKAEAEIERIARQIAELGAEDAVRDAATAIRLTLEAVLNAAKARRQVWELRIKAYALASEVGIECPDLPAAPAFDEGTVRTAMVLASALRLVDLGEPRTLYIDAALARDAAAVLESAGAAT